MLADIVRIVIVLIVGWGCYALNDAINTIPKLKQVIAIVIILCACLFVVAPIVDLIGLALSSAHVGSH